MATEGNKVKGLAGFVGVLRKHYPEGCRVAIGSEFAAAIVADYDALKVKADSADPPLTFHGVPVAFDRALSATVDERALEVARRFTQDTEPQRRASLQVAIVEAIKAASPPRATGVPAGWTITEREPGEYRISCPGLVTATTHQSAGDRGEPVEFALHMLARDLLASGALNEPFGNAEQLASLEQRARELLAAEQARHDGHDANARLLRSDHILDQVDVSKAIALRAITAALSAQPREVEVVGWVPDGWKLVPVEPSREMVDSGVMFGISPNKASIIYQSMVNAVPNPPLPRDFHSDGVTRTSQDAAPQPREVRGVDAVRALVAEWRQRPGITDAYKICATELETALATTPQDAAGVEQSVAIEQLSTNAPLRHSERADAEQAYTLTAFDYVRAPVGTHDWQLYWRGWWHRSQLYTAPPPGVHLEQFREPVIYWGAQQVMPERIAEGKHLLAIIDAAAQSGRA